MFDVLAKRLDNGSVRTISSRDNRDNADAIVKMAVYRRGCDEEIFYVVPHDPLRSVPE